MLRVVRLKAPYEITKPGAYAIPDAAYRADPCPTPSLTQSTIKTLLDTSPAHAFLESPRLNPDFEPDDPTKYDVGSIAHRYLIGRGKEVVVLDGSFEDWRKKEAQELRKKHTGQGLLAVLKKDADLATAMVEVAKQRQEEFKIGDAFNEGWGEVVLAWQEGDVWMRTMIDWVTLNGPFYDYKTTKLSVAPHALGWMAANAGWDIQAAMIERGLSVIDPANAGRRKARFIAQEARPPFAMSVMQMRESWLVMGRKKVAVGMGIWKSCLEANDWPAYPTSLCEPEYPTPAETSFLAREEEMSAQGAWSSLTMAPVRAGKHDADFGDIKGG